MIDVVSVDSSLPCWLNDNDYRHGSTTGVQYNARKLDTANQVNKKSSFKRKATGLLTLDWLTVNFTGEIDLGLMDFGAELEKGDFLFRFMGGTETFECRAIVFYKRRILGVLTWRPRQAKVRAELIQFRFDNHLFYEGSLIRNYFKIDRLIHFLGVDYEGVSRIDVAYDFNEFDFCGVQELLNLYHNDVIRSRGRKNVQRRKNSQTLLNGATQNDTYYEAFFEGEKIINALYLGSPNSGKCLKLYNKSLMLQQENKPYIVDCWNKVGLDARAVYRLEITYKSDYFRPKKYKDAEGNMIEEIRQPKLRDLFKIGFLANLFSKGCKYVFEFYYTDTLRTRTDRAKSYRAMDFERLIRRYAGFSVVADTMIQNKKKSKRGILNSCRSFFVRYVNNNQDFSALKGCLDHAASNLIYELVKEKFEKWLGDAWSEAIQYSPFNQQIYQQHLEEYHLLFYNQAFAKVNRSAVDNPVEKAAPVYVVSPFQKAPF
jgi:hypothetical protein